jgi:hypothetical protein
MIVIPWLLPKRILCLKKRTPLLNARKSASFKGRVAFIKVPYKKKGDESISNKLSTPLSSPHVES